jgi:aquaporin Z
MTRGIDMAGAPMVQGVETAGPARGMADALRRHWPEYLMEAAGLGLFMVSAGVCATLLWYPGSPLADAVPDGVGRRAVMGLIMGLTAIAIIYSPWDQQSGAHLNPALTLTFWRLGKVAGWDALF